MNALNLRSRKIGAYQIAPGIVRIKTHSQFHAEKLAEIKGARYVKRAVKEFDGLPYYFSAEIEFKRSLAWAQRLIARIAKPIPPPNLLAGCIPPSAASIQQKA